MIEARRRYVIGLGANLGDRLRSLQAAVESLARLGVLRAVSAIYETAPVGPPQPDYLNAAVLLETDLTPRALLNELLAIERAQGRERLQRWGPRTLDLDLLCSEQQVVDEPGLAVPHPELGRRAFALLPLLDVDPDARDARTGVAYAELLGGLDTSDVRRLDAPAGWAAGPNAAPLQPQRNTSGV